MSESEDGDNDRVDPDDFHSVNGHAIRGDGSPRDVDFSKVEIKDLGGSIQSIAADAKSSIQRAARESMTTGMPVGVRLTDVIATKNMLSSKNSIAQQGAIGRFGVNIDGELSVDKDGNITLIGRVTGISDKQDCVFDQNRNAIGAMLTEIGRIYQKVEGGKDYDIKFGGNQIIRVDISTQALPLDYFGD